MEQQCADAIVKSADAIVKSAKDPLGAAVLLRCVGARETKSVLGNVAEIKKILRITKINLWSNLATRGRRVHLHTLVDRARKRSRERG